MRDVRNTQISLAIAGVFLVCHSVRWIPNIWELQQTITEQVGVNLYTYVEAYFGSLLFFEKIFQKKLREDYFNVSSKR